MIFKELTVKRGGNFTNLEAQAVVQRAMRYDSDIFFEQGTRKINAKSLMGVISMGLKCGDKIMVIVKGDDQDEALAELVTLFNKHN